MSAVDEVVKQVANAVSSTADKINGNYAVNYNDKRFTEVENDKKEALSDVEKTYGGMINQSDKYYQDQINASKEWAETQKQNQQAQTDFAIEKIEQQKAQAQKDYTKEQSGAYTDWQQQSNQYGANAEAMAANGMANGGYSESSQVAMYNQYQQRVSSAREVYNQAVLNYNNAITEARLQNNSILAEIAYEAQKQQLELALAGFQYKNTLVLEKAKEKREVNNMYYGRYQDVLKQINQENALAEEVRQYNASMAEEKRQFNASNALQERAIALDEAQFAWQKAQAAEKSSGGSGTINKSPQGRNKSTGTTTKKTAKKTTTIKNTQNKKSKKSSEPTVDMKSVLDLGYGPISPKKLNQLVKEGKAIETEKNGKLKYKKVFNY